MVLEKVLSGGVCPSLSNVPEAGLADGPFRRLLFRPVTGPIDGSSIRSLLTASKTVAETDPETGPLYGPYIRSRRRPLYTVPEAAPLRGPPVDKIPNPVDDTHRLSHPALFASTGAGSGSGVSVPSLGPEAQFWIPRRSRRGSQTGNGTGDALRTRRRSQRRRRRPRRRCLSTVPEAVCRPSRRPFQRRSQSAMGLSTSSRRRARVEIASSQAGFPGPKKAPEATSQTSRRRTLQPWKV
ncbi:hypothetical protein M885DRAFT_209370 [Pelagophyceae sp. CCMP2097]|nr:hypothetical protein M885DRAFT_209370 [Pelagophyceae sp. CCMP2097]